LRAPFPFVRRIFFLSLPFGFFFLSLLRQRLLHFSMDLFTSGGHKAPVRLFAVNILMLFGCKTESFCGPVGYGVQIA
jgi:hypothetical protein